MRRSRLVLPLLFSLLCMPVCVAQSASKIIDQFVKAAGGGKALSRIQTLRLDGAIPAGDGAQPGTYSFVVKQPNRYCTEIRNAGKTTIEAYNGKSAWHESGSGELATFLGPHALEVEAAAQYYNAHLLGLSKKKIAAVVKGPATIQGRSTTQVELTFATRLVWNVFFDDQTHLILSEKATIAGVDREIFYSDYRVVNGVKVPHKIELHLGSETIPVTVTRAAVNETVGERVFDFPIKAQVKLPDLKKLFEEIDANQKQIDKVKENYAGTQVEEETEFDKNGKVTKKDVSEYTFFYLNGDQITTLVKKDGKALGDEEQKKENEKTQKRIEEAQKNQKKKDEKEEKAREEGKDSKDKDEPGIEMFLRVCQFVNPRRERFRGQDVLVFDFEPNPEYKTKNLPEKIVKELAGVIWVDEQAKDVVRLEGYFIDDVHIAGGLVANLQKGTGFTFEQAYINNEVWLPTYVEAHVGARVLLVKGFRVNVVTRYSDYKRFNVATLNTIARPKDAPEPQPKPN